MSRESKNKLFGRLGKSRSALLERIKGVFSKSDLSKDALMEQLEEQLILSDLGFETTEKIIQGLGMTLRKQADWSRENIMVLLRQEMLHILSRMDPEPDYKATDKPFVILMVGVNGVGKTTTTAKIAAHFKSQGRGVMLAACDTYRAAAIEQLQSWGEGLQVPVICGPHGSDAAAVAHDAYSAAKARKADLLIIDSAGRQHTNVDLMNQLEKLSRVLKKHDSAAPHEVMLVLDATTGQNALSQFTHFDQRLKVSGICLTKLDGSAKGGVVFSLVEQHDVPVRFLGTGEGTGDIEVFDAERFLDALLPNPAD